MVAATELVTAKELGTTLRVKPCTVKQWTKEGIIPAVRINARVIRYSIPMVIAALEARPVEVCR